MRTTDTQLLKEATARYATEIHGLDHDLWVLAPENIALVDENGNVSMFEHDRPGVVYGHFFYKARGRAALKAAKGHLKELFEGGYGIEVIKGLTPVEHLGAAWLSKKIGFTQHGIIDTDVGKCILFILTKQEWENSQ